MVSSIIFILLLSFNLFATEIDYPSKLSHRQVYILTLAHDAGIKIGFPETIQAIAFQETLLGTYRNQEYGIVGDRKNIVGERSYGVFQVKVETARRVLKEYPHLKTGKYFPTDEHLIVALMTDDMFCAIIAAYYFDLMYSECKDWKLALKKYNGVTDLTTDPNKYVPKIWSHIIHLVRPFNEGKYPIVW